MKFSIPCTDCFLSSPLEATQRLRQDGKDHESFRIFTCKELKYATKGFHASNKLGEGGFGSVYKDKLKDGTFVAIKVLSIELESMRGEREFIAELAALSVISHENLVKLVGCCVDVAARYLVYDYMINNSLAHIIRMRFCWDLRKSVVLGIARGLAYLHFEVEPHVLHRDIKVRNILLDENSMPNVGDFGLSKLLRENHSHTSTQVEGTMGYLAPEYAISGRLTRKSDVYSFGVLLLEIVSGRAIVDFDMQLGEQFLVQKAWESYTADNLLQFVDPTLQMHFPKDEALRFLKIGLLCVQEMSQLRPRMTRTVEMLAGEIEMKDYEISQLGLVSDFTNIKIGQNQSSEPSTFSRGSATSTIQTCFSSDEFKLSS